MFHVVSYDISDDRKRNRAAKILLDYGKRVQFSVFECVLDNEQLGKLVSRLRGLVSGEDSVRVYSLCSGCEKRVEVIGSGAVTKDENVIIL